jgi:hypothetical protein
MSATHGKSCRYSILIPLERHRNTLTHAVQAWQNQQGISPDEVEFVLVTTDAQAACQARKQWPGFQVLHEPHANMSRVYDLAARAANGDILIFTEAHCLPASNFLQQLQAEWKDLPCVGITAHIQPVCPSRLAQVDAQLWQEGWRILVQTPGEWRRFNIQGTALRRDIYLKLGGLPYQYNRFAEMVFAAQLRDAGYTIAYSDKLIIQHIFRSELFDYISDIYTYVEGENVYRRETRQTDQPGHSFVFPLPRDAHKVTLLRELRRTLLRDVICRSLWQRDGVTLRLLRYAWRLLSSHGYPLLRRYRWQSRWAILRCQLWRWISRSRLEAAYRDIWPALSRYLRLSDMLRYPCVNADFPTEGYCAITAWPEDHRLGFYEPERVNGQTFCWTGPLAVLRLPPCDRDRTVELGLLSAVAPAQRQDIRIWFDGQRLPPETLRYQSSGLSLSIPPASRASCLILGCLPLHPWRHGTADFRSLGLPIVSVSVHTAGQVGVGRVAKAA